MLNIEHLFEKVLDCMERDEDLNELEQHPATQYLLKNMSATFDEVVAIASYVIGGYRGGTLFAEQMDDRTQTVLDSDAIGKLAWKNYNPTNTKENKQ